MKGYRTVIVNALMFLVAVASYFGVSEALPDMGAINTFVDHLDAIVAFVLPWINVGMRMVTNTAIGSKT
jgi:hypothetical protein